jgi:hypothetical protein
MKFVHAAQMLGADGPKCSAFSAAMHRLPGSCWDIKVKFTDLAKGWHIGTCPPLLNQPLPTSATASLETISSYVPSDMVEMDTKSVYVGTWRNYGAVHIIRLLFTGADRSNHLDQAAILGDTLTIESRWGLILNTFLALFISWVGLETWSLLCFVIHQWRSTVECQDAIYHQLQVLLRAGLRDWQLASKLIGTAYSWSNSRNGKRPIRRLAPFILLALVHGVSFAVASILSAKVATTNGQVLLQSTNCGFPDTNDVQFNYDQLLSMSKPDVMGASALRILAQNVLQWAKEYVDGCYAYSPVSANTCDNYVRQYFASTTNVNGTCIFHDNICLSPSVTFESGYIDSHFDIGINAPPQDRISVQKRMSCAPIDAERFSSDWITLPIQYGLLCTRQT